MKTHLPFPSNRVFGEIDREKDGLFVRSSLIGSQVLDICDIAAMYSFLVRIYTLH
tara:strand:+ start:701 stop:865 length:165 start_codon:yes stop_codon:yes gene_type:complete